MATGRNGGSLLNRASWVLVKKGAMALLEHGTLTGARFKELVLDGKSEPWLRSLGVLRGAFRFRGPVPAGAKEIVRRTPTSALK